MRLAGLSLLALLTAAPALAQSAADPFKDGPGYAKVHAASGFVCPAAIGPFERDAAGEYDVTTGADICSYAALDGIYGTIILTPLTGPYDAKNSLAPQFVEEEGTGGKRIGEKTMSVAGLSVFTRSYRTARAESLEYRKLFAGAQVGNWAVEAIVEYADPRDDMQEKEFLATVYAGAAKDIAQPSR
ncbi:MAG TPA: hypothetical protein VG867_04165 [Rhizomicrobium sp.]|nr:hypothetical protein [Rhizomicrobium sp.]